MLKYLNYFQLFLFCLIPLLLVTGPFLSDLSITLIGVIFIICIINTNNFQFIKSKFSIYFFIYYLIFIIASLNSNNILFSFESSLFYFRFGLFFLAIHYIIENSKNFNSYFLFFLFLTFLILIIDGFYQYFTAYNFLGYHYGGNRLSGLFGNEQKLGNFLIRLLPIILAFFIISKTKIINSDYFLILFSIVVGTLIFISGERNAVVLFLIFVILFTLLIIKSNFLKLAFLAIFLLISVSLLSETNIKQRLILNTIDSVKIKDSNELYFISEEHQGLILTSIKMGKENLLTGVGPKMFRNECMETKYQINHSTKDSLTSHCSTHPHNIYAQLFAETGIIGLSPLILFFIIITALLCREILLRFNGKIILSRYQCLLLIAIFLNFLPFVPSYNFFNNWISIIYYIPIGLLFNSIQNQDIKNETVN